MALLLKVFELFVECVVAALLKIVEALLKVSVLSFHVLELHLLEAEFVLGLSVVAC